MTWLLASLQILSCVLQYAISSILSVLDASLACLASIKSGCYTSRVSPFIAVSPSSVVTTDSKWGLLLNPRSVWPQNDLHICQCWLTSALCWAGFTLLAPGLPNGAAAHSFLVGAQKGVFTSTAETQVSVAHIFTHVCIQTGLALMMKG